MEGDRLLLTRLRPLPYYDRWTFFLIDLQSLGTDEGIKMLVKTLFFYIAITLEAFIFCFAGEYLSNKVSIRNHLSETFFLDKAFKNIIKLCWYKKIEESIQRGCSCENETPHAWRERRFVFLLLFIRILEQNDRRCGIWICLVHSQASGLPHSTVDDNEIAKTANDHCGEIYGFIVARIHKRKISIMELWISYNYISLM